MSVRISQLELFEKAMRSHRIAADALKSLSSAGISAHEMDRWWTEFVNQWENSLKFCIMATDSGRHKSIADQIKSDRKSDARLQYLFQARNSEYHGANIISKQQSVMKIKAPGAGSAFVSFLGDGPTNIVFENGFYDDGYGMKPIPSVSGRFFRGSFDGTIGDPQFMEMIGPSFALVPVENRGVTYEVPMKDVDDKNRPYELAKFGLKYLTERIEEISKAFE